MKQWVGKEKRRGFTIVELLIVVVVIGILAAIVTIAFNGVQQRARDAKRANDIKSVAKAIESYYAIHGSYPSTGGISNGFSLSDSNCPDASPHTEQWVPGLVPDIISKLPQSEGPRTASDPRCYKYISDGSSYIISAWRAVEQPPNTSLLRRNLGFREPAFSASDGYYCGTPVTPGSYWDNYYSRSYTISNITSCNSGT